MDIIWTVDQTGMSWTEWAANMACSPASPLASLLAKAMPENPGGWALDLGCGTGRAFAPLSEHGYRILGLDRTVVALRAAGARSLREHLPAFLLAASVACLPLGTQSMEIILAIGILFHLSPVELNSALVEIRRVLKPDGRAWLYFLDVHDWRRKLGEVVAPSEVTVYGNQPVVTCFSSQAANQAIIESSGLEIVERQNFTHWDDRGERREWVFICHP